VRAYDPDMGFAAAMKLLLVSFDSTLKANLSVGAPFDYHFYGADSLRAGLQGRIEAEDVYYRDIADRWGEALKDALDGLPDFDLPPA
jgi:putative proteasome-type protease